MAQDDARNVQRRCGLSLDDSIDPPQGRYRFGEISGAARQMVPTRPVKRFASQNAPGERDGRSSQCNHANAIHWKRADEGFELGIRLGRRDDHETTTAQRGLMTQQRSK